MCNKYGAMIEYVQDILVFPCTFSGLQDIPDLSQEFLHNCKASSLHPLCWWCDPGQAVPQGRIAGGCQLGGKF